MSNIGDALLNTGAIVTFILVMIMAYSCYKEYRRTKHTGFKMGAIGFLTASVWSFVSMVLAQSF